MPLSPMKKRCCKFRDCWYGRCNCIRSFI